MLLRAESLSTYRKSGVPNKWRPKYLGPFRIVDTLGPVTYRIKMPPSMRQAHNVVHVSKLKPYHRPRHEKSPLNITIDQHGTVEQEVVAILDKKRKNRKDVLPRVI